MGDFCLQSDYFAMNKAKRIWPCFLHVLIYTACFLILTTSWKALLLIGVTHFILDHWPVILKRLIWAKNHLGPHFVYVPYDYCDVTGYFDNIKAEVDKDTDSHSHWVNEWTVKDKDGKDKRVTVPYLARLNYITIWLYIITDNFCHLAINYMALKYLG